MNLIASLRASSGVIASMLIASLIGLSLAFNSEFNELHLSVGSLGRNLLSRADVGVDTNIERKMKMLKSLINILRLMKEHWDKSLRVLNRKSDLAHVG